MKKWIAYMGAGAIALTLAGCGESAEPSEETDPKETSDLTLEELFAKTTAASEEAKSFHMDMVTNQTMVMGPEMDMDMKMDISMDMTVEPLAFYQKAQSSFISEGMEDMPPMETEMYYTADGLYSYDPMMDMWVKLPADEMEDLEALMMMEQQSGDLAGQFEQLEAFQDDFTFEQTGDEFVLTLDAAGEEYEKLISEEMGQMLGELDVEAQEIMDGMTINKIYYEIFIDKETFQPNTINMTMDFDMEMEGESVNIQSDMQAEYSNFNGIDTITVPAEVIENAEEMNGY
ncbi:DUF6612 family protein [Planococcus halotolerans]|uniref:Lipoprotein n=1 Tax=Planococcus halotolerans TaxID=2233542 RepID=A0A365KR97_9BACL|nr:DUF6612 family protein [Planococcus halotolerans]QHJ69325.1 hypothetical protein DNR44_001175 [Planococcus halotolerans]RAZ75694.1 hypothetical protein DP120_12900 [Planococcus halotolerans]